MQTIAERVKRELGIDPCDLPEPSVYAWPVAETGQAQGLLANVTLATAVLGAVATNTARIPEFEQVGISVESVDQSPWIVKLSSRDSTARIEVRTSAPGEAVRHGVSATWVDLQMASPLIVVGPEGEALAVADGDGLEVWSLSGMSIQPAASIEAPVDDWLRQAETTDSWLRREVNRKLEIGGPWAHVTAAALVARYLEPLDASVARNWTTSVLNARPIESIAAPRRWASQLESTQLRTVQELARAEADRLEVMLDDVADNAVPGEGAWQSEWLDVCHGRDDLEGVCLLLRETASDQALIARLEQLDRTGLIVRNVLPAAWVPADERGRRAHQLLPEVWWT